MAVLISKQLKVPERFLPPIWENIGDTITWDNKEWLVCHYDSANQQVYLIAKDIVSLTIYREATSIQSTLYLGSNLAAVAEAYETNEMSSSALKMIVETTVSGVTAKVFVPSDAQMDAGFSWFTDNSRRIANYNGVATEYWLSSGSNGVVYFVQNRGSRSAQTSSYVTRNYGFRPCVCVQL